MRRITRQEIITFKADAALLAALSAVPNRSEFIRNAVHAALDETCPLCRGRGSLTPNQRRHWTALATSHGLRECDDCHEVHLVCPSAPNADVHRHATRRGRRAR